MGHEGFQKLQADTNLAFSVNDNLSENIISALDIQNIYTAEESYFVKLQSQFSDEPPVIGEDDFWPYEWKQFNENEYNYSNQFTFKMQVQTSNPSNKDKFEQTAETSVTFHFALCDSMLYPPQSKSKKSQTTFDLSDQDRTVSLLDYFTYPETAQSMCAV